MKDLRRNITLLCPICGNDQFESLDEEYVNTEDTPDEARYKCSDCGEVFSYQELIDENKEKIDIALDELEQDAAKEIEKEFKKMLKKLKF